MAKNLLLVYSEELATRCELLCKSISGNSNTVFQLRKSSSSVFANITEAQYPQSLADMLSKFKIARKECAETESWLKLLYNTKTIDEETFKTYRNLCGRIQRMLTSSCITIEKKIDNKQFSKTLSILITSFLYTCIQSSILKQADTPLQHLASARTPFRGCYCPQNICLLLYYFLSQYLSNITS